MTGLPVGELHAWPLGLLLALQLAGLWFAADAVMRGRTAQGAIAWSLGLALVPLFAVPLYLMFGERKFAGYARARRHGDRATDRIAKQLHEALRPYLVPSEGRRRDARALERLARLPFSTGNSVNLLIDGEATFDAILNAIEHASSYVLLQFYTIRDDALGRRVQASLLDAIKRGVRVYLLYDEIGSYRLPRSYLRALTDAGCKCGGFRTKPRRQKAFRINFRNHRKAVVVDGHTAFVGGHNVGDEYLGRSAAFGEWRDTNVVIRGPAALCVQLVFVEDWHWANGYAPDVSWTPAPARGAAIPVLIVPTGPADELETGALMVTHLANTARKRLWIASPYFVPDEQILGALQLAALRGVDVRVLTAEKTDSALPWISSFSYYDDLLPVGIRLYRYLPGFLHQKVVLCDDVACVGTANLDNRSLRINFELTAVVEDADFAGRLALMLEQDLSRSRPAVRGEFEGKSVLFRFGSRLARLLAPIQ